MARGPKSNSSDWMSKIKRVYPVHVFPPSVMPWTSDKSLRYQLPCIPLQLESKFRAFEMLNVLGSISLRIIFTKEAVKIFKILIKSFYEFIKGSFYHIKWVLRETDNVRLLCLYDVSSPHVQSVFMTSLLVYFK